MVIFRSRKRLEIASESLDEEERLFGNRVKWLGRVASNLNDLTVSIPI